MTGTRVPKGEKYWYLAGNLKVKSTTEQETIYDETEWLNHNYFHTKEEAKQMLNKLWAVLKGAEIMEDWQKEKIASWDTMLETKDEISKNYSKLLNNPKVQAILKGAEVIEMPSEEEMLNNLPSDWSYEQYMEGAGIGWHRCYEWLKSKIVK